VKLAQRFEIFKLKVESSNNLKSNMNRNVVESYDLEVRVVNLEQQVNDTHSLSETNVKNLVHNRQKNKNVGAKDEQPR